MMSRESLVRFGGAVFTCAAVMTCYRARPAPLSTHLVIVEPAMVSSVVAGPPSDGCPIRLADEPSGARLTLMRSVSNVDERVRGDTIMRRFHAVGDYAVDPAGSLGVQANQRLRVDCGTLSALEVIDAKAS
jgi:hypothetical protein